MEKCYLRILTIRKHKTVTFISAYNDEYGHMQYMLNNDLYNTISCGDLIICNVVNDKNNRGQSIKKITKIEKIIKCKNFQSYKGLANNVNNQRLSDYLNARNCGSQIELLKYKRELLTSISNILKKLNYFDATGLLNNIEYYSNGSGIEDAIIENRDLNQPKYLRVTMENQLKQITATLLKSSYAIEKVYRNMGEDAGHINEFLMLELVSINSNMSQMLDFIKKIDYLSKEIADKHSISISNKELKVIDYSEIKKYKFNKIKKELDNIVIMNYPCQSPYILKNSFGERSEIRWYCNGHWIGHYYNDENDYNNVKEVIDEQNMTSNKPNVNPMNYFEWGLPPTISFGLSIDRWLQSAMNIDNINSVANPIQLDFKKER